MRVLLTGGGTAGHINPALAMAGYLCEKEPETEILYVGNKGGMEERLVAAAGYNFRPIRISGFQRKLTLNNIKRNLQTVVRVVTASVEAKKILKEFKPDICIGTGGYVCGPVIRAAQKMGIATAVHEANAYPGMAIKMLAPKCDSVMLAVEDAKKFLERKDNCEFTGNPVRLTVLGAKREESRKALGLDARPVVLSFGGSLGAEAINKAAAYMLGESAKEKKFQHIHGYGRYDEHFVDNVRAAGVSEAENPQIRLLEYINNMPECLAAADLVIARAGAITLTEIQATGKCAVLIPSPNVAENHQFHNAMALVNRDAAVLIEEKELTGEKLWQTVQEILSQPGRAEEIGRNAKAMAVLDANERIYQIICRIVRGKNA